MPTLDELLATLEEDDPDAAKALREQLSTAAGEKDQLAKQLASKNRELKLATDKSFRERYPRALMVFDRGKLQLPDDLDDAGLIKALAEKEEELADLGVPMPAAGASASGDKTPAKTEEPGGDPAESWGEPVGGSPRTTEKDPVKDYWEALRGTTNADRLKAFQAITELNRQGEQRPEGKLWELAKQMEEVDEFNKPIDAMKW